MGLVLISLIFNFFYRSVFKTGLFFFFLSSCSTPKVQSPQDEKKLTPKETQVVSYEPHKIHHGPLKSDSEYFRDVTETFGLNDLYAVTFNAVDLNFDGHTDLVLLPSYYSRPKFYLWNSTLNKFLPWAHDPLPLDFKASFLLFYDINKDQVPDLISSVLNQKSEITQIPIKIFWGKIHKGIISFLPDEKALDLPPGPHSGMSLIDYDLDGWVDLFISNWFENKNNQFLPLPDRLIRNAQGKFQDVSHLLKGETDKASNQLYAPNARPTYGASTCDIDQNGWPDILTVSSSGYKNKLWMNLKDSTSGLRYFEDFGPVSNYASDPNGSLISTGGGRTFFSACSDYNNDGIMDVFLGELSHSYDNESVDRSSILTGSRESFPPYFLRTEYLSDAHSDHWNQGDRRGVWVDYNLDGRIDLLVDNSGFPPFSRLVLFEQDKNHSFFNISTKAGIDIVNPTGTVVLDINKDGAPDILTSQNNIRNSDIPPRLFLFQNTLKKTGKSLKVHLNGIKSNTDGIGALLTLALRINKKKMIQKRWVEYSQGGLPSQNESGVVFGIPKDARIQYLKVRWPFVKKSGFGAGQILEKKYSLTDFFRKGSVEVTVCENGSVLPGKMSCGL
jgi:hypothetical protein